MQHGAHDELDPQRHPRTVPEAEVDLGRERARLGAVPDATARRPVPDAAIGGAHAQAPPERLHARALLVHDAADGNQQHESVAGNPGDDQRRDPAPVRFGLAALRLRPAVDDLRPAVPVRAGQAQHPRASTPPASSGSTRRRGR